MEVGNSILNQTKLTTPENKHGMSSGVKKSLNKADVTIRLTLVILTVITIYTFLTMDYGNVNVSKAIMDTFSNFKLMFFKPYSHHLTVWDAFYGAFLTLGMAFITTLIGAVIALPLGLMAAQNLAPKWLTNLIKAFVALIRAIPTILWVLIFAVTAGLGSTAAVIGMTFHTVSYLTKAYSESFEDLDRGTIEALEAAGANFWQIVLQAVLPCSATYLLSWTFMRFEINFGNAVAMGAAAGAAGIGFDMYMASGFYFDLQEVGLITYFILAFAILLEAFSTKIKRRIRKGV
jgi:phosphonate transport system permease protein